MEAEVVSDASGIIVAAGVIIGALSWTLWSFVRRAIAGDVGGVINMAGVWLVGIVSTFLICSADIVNRYSINGTALADLDGGSRVVIGLIFTSLFAMVPYDFLKGIDNSQTAAVPNPFAAANRAVAKVRAGQAPSSTPGPSPSP